MRQPPRVLIQFININIKGCAMIGEPQVAQLVTPMNRLVPTLTFPIIFVPLTVPVPVPVFSISGLKAPYSSFLVLPVIGGSDEHQLVVLILSTDSTNII
jgi:hypothetical protein